MKRRETTTDTPPGSRIAAPPVPRVPARRERSPNVRRRAGRDAFCAAHEALAGRPAGNSRFDIEFSLDPAEWRYSARMIPGKFAGTDLAKANLEVTACISWFWADKFGEEAWEAAVAGADLVPLGAEPLPKLPRHAEAGWLVHALSKPMGSAPYTLQSWPIFALQAGGIHVHRHVSESRPQTSLREAGIMLRNTITARITERLQG